MQDFTDTRKELLSNASRAPTRTHPCAPYPYTYMRTYVHHEFGLTAEGGRAVERGAGLGGGGGGAKYCTCQQFGTNSYN